MPVDLDPLSDAEAPPSPLSQSSERHARDALGRASLVAPVVRPLEEIRCGSASSPGGEDQRHLEHAGMPDTMPQAEFLSMLAHELRNPLQSMAMANQLLARSAPSGATAAEAQGVLDRQIAHMSRLLDDLLDASRAANGKIILETAPVRLGDVVNAPIETSHPDIHRREQHLRVGSSLTITLPLAAIPPAETGSPGTRGAAVRKILIIEDNIDANELMAMLLEMGGHEVTSSFDGADGLRVALAGQFDIVLCDLGLPGLTGLQVVAQLKAARPHDAPFAVATTGYSDGAQRDLARAAGFDHFAVKPIDMPALFKVIAACQA